MQNIRLEPGKDRPGEGDDAGRDGWIATLVGTKLVSFGLTKGVALSRLGSAIEWADNREHMPPT